MQTVTIHIYRPKKKKLDSTTEVSLGIFNNKTGDCMRMINHSTCSYLFNIFNSVFFPTFLTRCQKNNQAHTSIFLGDCIHDHVHA